MNDILPRLGLQEGTREGALAMGIHLFRQRCDECGQDLPDANFSGRELFGQGRRVVDILCDYIPVSTRNKTENCFRPHYLRRIGVAQPFDLQRVTVN